MEHAEAAARLADSPVAAPAERPQPAAWQPVSLKFRERPSYLLRYQIPIHSIPNHTRNRSTIKDLYFKR